MILEGEKLYKVLDRCEDYFLTGTEKVIVFGTQKLERLSPKKVRQCVMRFIDHRKRIIEAQEKEMTEMRKKYFRRKADNIRKTRQVTFSTACKRLAFAFENMKKALD